MFARVMVSSTPIGSRVIMLIDVAHSGQRQHAVIEHATGVCDIKPGVRSSRKAAARCRPASLGVGAYHKKLIVLCAVRHRSHYHFGFVYRSPSARGVRSHVGSVYVVQRPIALISSSNLSDFILEQSEPIDVDPGIPTMFSSDTKLPVAQSVSAVVVITAG